jgi:hypothetical protein
MWAMNDLVYHEGAQTDTMMSKSAFYGDIKDSYSSSMPAAGHYGNSDAVPAYASVSGILKSGGPGAFSGALGVSHHLECHLEEDSVSVPFTGTPTAGRPQVLFQCLA